MGQSEIRAQLAAMLGAVEGMGIVHEYERFAKEWSRFLDFFKAPDGSINGWMISRQATPARRDNIPTIERRHKFILRGFYGLNDAAASELTFQDLVDRVQAAFDNDNTLGGTVLDSGPAQVEIVENRVFGNLLCHCAEISIEAVERAFYQ